MTKGYLALLVGIICFCITSSINGQVTITPNPTVDRMLERYIEINKEDSSVKGFRIQLLATNDRQQFDNFKRSFESRYPNISTSWEHTNPYYKLRAGAFTSKSEATRMLHILKKEYSGAYLVIDNEISALEVLGR